MHKEDQRKTIEVISRITSEIHFAAEEIGVAHTAIGSLHSSMNFVMHCASTPEEGMAMILHIMQRVIDPSSLEDDDDE